MSVLNLTCKLNEAGLNKQVQDLLTTVRFFNDRRHEYGVQKLTTAFGASTGQ